MKIAKVIFLIVGVCLFLSSCGQGIKNAKNWPIEDFTYTNQNGKPFGLKDLEGKVWVADFVFTNCDDVCLPMTANMKKLQDLTEKEGIENIQFVSFSVDPTIDTPEVLKEYGKMFSADFENWHFLTGYEQKEIEDFALSTFKEMVKKPESGDQVIHGTRFFLVDGEGKIQKYYSGLADIPMDELVKDIKTLQ